MKTGTRRAKVASAVALAVVSLSLAPRARARETEAILRFVSRIERVARPRLVALTRAQGLAYPPGDVFLRAFKYESILELWARQGQEGPFRLLKTYEAHNLPRNYRRPPLAPGDDAGPKRRQGDVRVPEGCYKLLYHNPWSIFYLSLAVDYPNPADAILGRRLGVVDRAGERAVLGWYKVHGGTLDRSLLRGAPWIWNSACPAYPLGSEIFIHGKDVSIGCIPIGDRGIEEVFALTDARVVGGTRVHIHPFRYGDPRNRAMRLAYEREHPGLVAFWASLEAVYLHFERHRKVPPLYVDRRTGLYSLTPGSATMRY